MPIQGPLWPVEELMEVLAVKKSRIWNLADEHNWFSPAPGVYHGGSINDRTTPDAYLHARARKAIQSSRALLWSDDRDIDCPVQGCEGICLKWPDEGHYKCAYGHEGKI